MVERVDMYLCWDEAFKPPHSILRSYLIGWSYIYIIVFHGFEKGIKEERWRAKIKIGLALGITLFGLARLPWTHASSNKQHHVASSNRSSYDNFEVILFDHVANAKRHLTA